MFLTLDERCKWTQHVLKMKDTCFPKLVYKFILAGRRNVGQPRKRWEEANTHVNKKRPKMAYTVADEDPSLVLHLLPHMVQLWR
jgi:hypothetical protein